MRHARLAHDARLGVFLWRPVASKERCEYDDHGVLRPSASWRITWTICGWSLAYGGDGSSPFFGGFDQLGFLGGVTDMLAEAEVRSGGWRRIRPCDADCHLPDGVLHDHHRHYHGLSCRPHEVRRGVRVRGSVDHRGVPAARPYGLGRRRQPDRRHHRRARLRRRRCCAHLLWLDRPYPVPACSASARASA